MHQPFPAMEQEAISSAIFVRTKYKASVGQEINNVKNSFIKKAGLFVVALPIFVLLQAPSSAAYNEASYGINRKVNSCGDKSVAFPDTVFARLSTDIGGSVSGFEIHASYDDGNCTSVLYASTAKESPANSDFRKNRNDLIVALN